VRKCTAPYTGFVKDGQVIPIALNLDSRREPPTPALPTRGRGKKVVVKVKIGANGMTTKKKEMVPEKSVG
jgi:hypothetical protein